MQDHGRSCWNSLLSLKGETARFREETFSGIFMEAPELLDFDSGLMVRADHPSFFVHSLDLPRGLREGESLSLQGKLWRIREISNTGQGRRELSLADEL